LGPHPAALVEIDADEFAEAFAFLDDEFDLVAFGEFEFFELLLSGEGGAFDGVVADVAFEGLFVFGFPFAVGLGGSLAFMPSSPPMDFQVGALGVGGSSSTVTSLT
jgi:hypothetical protein